MARKIAIGIQKGGVGKTTLAINLAALAARGYPDKKNQTRVLLVDADPQANATSLFLGPEVAQGPEPGYNLYHVLCSDDDVAPEDVIRSVPLKQADREGSITLDILPAHSFAELAEIELLTRIGREMRLRRWLGKVERRYQYIFIDCPPRLGQLTVNALMASDEVVIPVSPGLFPMEGLALFRKTIEQVRSSGNQKLRINGICAMMLEPFSHSSMSRLTWDTLQANFPDLMLPGVPRRSFVQDAILRRSDALGHEPAGAGSTRKLNEATQAFMDVLAEVIKRG